MISRSENPALDLKIEFKSSKGIVFLEITNVIKKIKIEIHWYSQYFFYKLIAFI